MLCEPHLGGFVVAAIGNQYIKGKCYIKETSGNAEEAQRGTPSLTENIRDPGKQYTKNRFSNIPSLVLKRLRQSCKISCYIFKNKQLV